MIYFVTVFNHQNIIKYHKIKVNFVAVLNRYYPFFAFLTAIPAIKFFLSQTIFYMCNSNDFLNH